MEKWHMYMQIYQLKAQGFKIRRIARKLGISRTTIYKYLEKSPEEMSEWMAPIKTRTKKLYPYEMLIHTWLTKNPDLSATQNRVEVIHFRNDEIYRMKHRSSIFEKQSGQN